MAPTRHALTLLEVSIAILLLATMLTVALESQLGVRSYINMEREQSELEFIGRRLTNELVNDIGNAARFVRNNAFLYPDVTRSPAAPLAANDPAEMRRKDEIQFTRVRTSTTAAVTPGAEQYAIIDIETPWTSLSDYVAAPYTHFLVLDPTNTTNMVRPVWEAPTSGLDAAQNEDPVNLRLFAIRVVDVDARGRGRLVRCYWNGNGNPIPPVANWTIDRELARDVRRFSVETYDWQVEYFNADPLNRPKPDLSQWQIRFEITLERDQGVNQPPVTRTVNVTAAMRSVT